MRFLADAGISPKTVEFLHQLGHDAIHCRELGLQRAEDSELIRKAREAQVLAERGEVLRTGALVLVEDARYRVRILPLRR